MRPQRRTIIYTHPPSEGPTIPSLYLIQSIILTANSDGTTATATLTAASGYRNTALLTIGGLSPEQHLHFIAWTFTTTAYTDLYRAFEASASYLAVAYIKKADIVTGSVVGVLTF